MGVAAVVALDLGERRGVYDGDPEGPTLVEASGDLGESISEIREQGRRSLLRIHAFRLQCHPSRIGNPPAGVESPTEPAGTATEAGYPTPAMSYRAVIFDLGGVVLDSPLHAIARYERDLGIPGGHINRVVVETGPTGAWSRLERGELQMDEFFGAFDRECAEAGHVISAAEMMMRIASATAPRPAMLEAIRRLRTHAFRVAALTNNWADESADATPRHAELRDLFHVFVESSVVGLRKPDPRIYEHTCSELGVAPDESVFLDDIGSNLKSARALGMHTIKVESAAQALGELARAIDLDLSSE